MLLLKAQHPPRLLISGLNRYLATESTAFSIPVVDFSAFKKAASPTEKRQTADKIVGAFKQSGFIYLSGHGIPRSVIHNTFEHSRKFFELPLDVKDKLAWEDPRSNRGYVKVGRERVTQSVDPDEIAALRKKAPDYKESMEIGRDSDATWKNMWPREADAPNFRATMLVFFQTCHNLHAEVMRSIALGLDLKESFFDDKIHHQCHNLRLLSYPPVKQDVLQAGGTSRAGAHSDYGTLTLLFQDQVNICYLFIDQCNSVSHQ
jgi:isopenicillin N synthase-like dioxygenase